MEENFIKLRNKKFLDSIILLNLRNNKHLKKLLVNWETNSYFNNLVINKNVNELRKLINIIKIKKLDSYEKVFDYTDSPENFYIILKGKVTIWIPNKFNKNKKYTKENLIKEIGSNFYYKFLNDENFINKDKNYCKFKKIKTLDEGDSFGELGLLNIYFRTATTIAYNDEKFLNNNIKYKHLKKRSIYKKDEQEKVILAYITKKEFHEILIRIEERKIFKTEMFFNKLFKNPLEKRLLFSIFPFFNKLIKTKNNHLGFKFDLINNLYIIKKGIIEVTDIININLIKYENNFESNDYKKYIDLCVKKNMEKPIIKKVINTKVKDLLKFDFIGIYEYFNNCKHHIFNYKVISDKAIIYEIDLLNFKFILNLYPNLLKIIKYNQINFEDYLKHKRKKIINFWKNNLKVFDTKKLIIKKSNINIPKNEIITKKSNIIKKNKIKKPSNFILFSYKKKEKKKKIKNNIKSSNIQGKFKTFIKDFGDFNSVYKTENQNKIINNPIKIKQIKFNKYSNNNFKKIRNHFLSDRINLIKKKKIYN